MKLGVGGSVVAVLVVLSALTSGGVLIGGGSGNDAGLVGAATAQTDAGTVNISGRLAYADGTPVDGWRVYTQGIEGTRSDPNDATNPDGRFKTTVVEDGVYSVEYAQRNDSRRVEFPKDGYPDLHVIRRVATERTDVDIGDVTLNRAHLVNITIETPDGTPVTSGEVTIGHVDRSRDIGIYEPATLEPTGEVRMRNANAPGVEINGTLVVIVRPSDPDLAAAQAEFEIDERRDVTVVVEPAVNVTGRIETSEGAPVTAGEVRLVSESTDTDSSALLNDTGEFTMAVTPNLSYEGWFTQERTAFPIDGVVDKHSLGTVDVGTTDVDLGIEELPEAHRLNVTVVDATGAPVENAEVDIEGTSGNPGPDVGNRTDAHGRFVLGGTVGTETNGTVDVHVDPPEETDLGENGTEVTVTGDRNLRIVLERQVEVRGRIESADGSPVTTGDIGLQNDSTETFGGAELADDGSFTIHVAPNLTYEGEFNQFDHEHAFPLDGVIDVHPLGTVAVGNENVNLGTITLPQAHRLNVTVVDDTGTPVENARVTVETTVEGVTDGVENRTDAEGRFVLGGTVGTETNGTVTVFVRPPDDADLNDNETTITVTEDRELRVVLRRMVTISGRVVDPAGEARSNEPIGVFDVAADGLDAFERTNTTGAFTATVPANDTYAVTFGDGSPDDRFPRNGIPDLYELAEVTPRTDVNLTDVTVPEGHVLDVRVVDGDGDPVGDAVVGVRSTRGDDTRGATAALRTDENGVARLDDRPYTGIEVAGPVAVEVNTTTADGAFTEPTVTRSLTVTENTTVTVTVERRSALVVDPTDPAAYDTIGAAVEDAPAGATVRVAPGTYEGPVRIDKPLALLGRPGDPAPGPADDAPVLDGGGERQAGIVLTDGATNVTIEGIELRNYTRAGIETASRVRNVTVSHNAIHDINGSSFPAGVSTFQLDAVHRTVVVERNRFEAVGGDAVLLLNVHGAVVRDNVIVGTSDVRTNFFGEGSAGGIVVAPWANRTDITTRNVRIQNNTITGTIVSAGIGVFPRNLTAGVHARAEAIRIWNNTVTGPNISRGVRITPASANTSISGVSLDGNVFRSVERGLVVDARPLGQEDGRGRIRRISVTRSVFANSTTDAIRMVAGNASALRVHNSSIVDSGAAGLNNSATGTVDATRNWWGASDGPSGAFDGSGDAVRGNATVRPFYVDAARTRLSSATLPPVVGDRRPRDPDDDGVYEDVNGDGDVTPGDATVLFRAVFNRTPAVTDNIVQFDFNGDGSLTPGDATVLFNEAF